MSTEIDSNTGKILNPLVFSDLPPFPLESFPFHKPTIETLKRLVMNPNGCQILLHGSQPESGRTTFAVSLAASAGKKVYCLEWNDPNNLDEIEKDFENLQERLDPLEHVLLVDDDEDLIRSKSAFNSFLPRFWMVNYLKENKLPLIWIVYGLEEIPSQVLRLFDFVLEFAQPVEKSFSWPSTVPRSWHPQLEMYLKIGKSALSVNYSPPEFTWAIVSRVATI